MFLTPLETDNKQILRRGVYPEHGRRVPQNDIATSPGRRAASLQPQFSKEVTKSTKLRNSKEPITKLRVLRTTMLENFRGSRKSPAVFSLWLQMLMLKIILAPSMSCTASAGRHLSKIPLFPPLPKGDERGIFFAAFASLRETFRASVAATSRCALRGEKYLGPWRE